MILCIYNRYYVPSNPLTYTAIHCSVDIFDNQVSTQFPVLSVVPQAIPQTHHVSNTDDGSNSNLAEEPEEPECCAGNVQVRTLMHLIAYKEQHSDSAS